MLGDDAGTSTISGGRPLTYLVMISREPRPRTAASEPWSAAQAMLQTATDAGRRLRCCSSFSTAAACRAAHAVSRTCKTDTREKNAHGVSGAHLQPPEGQPWLNDLDVLYLNPHLDVLQRKLLHVTPGVPELQLHGTKSRSRDSDGMRPLSIRPARQRQLLAAHDRRKLLSHGRPMAVVQRQQRGGRASGLGQDLRQLTARLADELRHL